MVGHEVISDRLVRRSPTYWPASILINATLCGMPASILLKLMVTLAPAGTAMVLVLKAKALAVISIVTLLDVVLFRVPFIESAAHAGTITSDSITSSSDVMQARFF